MFILLIRSCEVYLWVHVKQVLSRSCGTITSWRKILSSSFFLLLSWSLMQSESIGGQLLLLLMMVLCDHRREVLMEDKAASRDDICSCISTLPCQLGAEDIDDFFSLSQYYASRTPQSFRKVGWKGSKGENKGNFKLYFTWSLRIITVYCLGAGGARRHLEPTFHIPCVSPSASRNSWT